MNAELYLRLQELVYWVQMISLQPVGTCLNNSRVYEATLKAGQRGKAHVRDSQAAPVPNDFQDPQVYMGAQNSIIHCSSR